MSGSDFSHLEPAARIKLLCSQSDCVIVDGKIPLRRYFRSGLEMVRMADVYAEEGSLENAFILYMKFMTLFLEKIRSHPDFSNHSSIDKTINTKKLKEILPKAERLKNQLREKYQREYNVIVQEQKLLEEQFRRKQEEAQEEETRKRQQSEEDYKRRKDIKDEKKRIRDLQSIHHKHSELPLDDAPPAYDDLGSLSYPTSALTLNDLSNDDRPSGPPEVIGSSCVSPMYPPNSAHSLPNIPSRDLKPMLHSTPQVDRSSKPTSLLSANVGTKSGGLREVRVPSELMAKFMALAQPNTQRNVETCGILAGKLAQHRLLVTHLLVPKQCGTSDSCTTQQEEELFDYQDKLDLITIGWIHTHPTQTAFLSSVDLHTHCSYQLMMPEAVAIVCAPKYEETGFFTLTQDHGLPFIANCHQSGFHPHPKEPPLFLDASHVTLENSLPIGVIDLRDSK
ncbi:STAM-binding protein-like [Homarus americanus]|uniref:STAM-binding protein-like n=1 Tax=Homarus americanus TaxID=6706 RepID=UPI001C47D9F4|nr:STAM-binding protein-like [Homarus americanus]XP_042238032.1 STAM-binding protein-like [Homarus americanus]